MRRAHTVTFKTEYKGHVIFAHSNDGGELRFTSEVLKETVKHFHSEDTYERDKTYDKVDSILDALDRYDLSLRKDFTNKIAYRVIGGYRTDMDKVATVEVTSITEDGREAWIKYRDKDQARYNSSGREKVNINSLYATKEVCQEYARSLKRYTEQYEKNKEAATKELEREENRWKPLTTKN